MPGSDFRNASLHDRGVLIAAAVVFVASFLPYIGIRFGPFGSVSISAWHGYPIVGLLLLFAAGVFAALRVFGNVRLPVIAVGWNVLATGVCMLGTVLLIIGGITSSPASLQWGGYVLLIAAIVQTVFTALVLRGSGEKLPWKGSASRDTY